MNQSHKSISKRTISIAFAILAALTLTVGLSFWWLAHNYAQDAARPLDKVLSDGGAVKVCDSGDPGRGPDNYAPHYASLYEIAANKDDAIRLVTKAATENGYSLTYNQSPYPNIAWYWDTVGKKSDYPGFSKGNVTIRFSIYSAGEKRLYCSGKPLQSDETHSSISLEVRLPDSKQ